MTTARKSQVVAPQDFAGHLYKKRGRTSALLPSFQRRFLLLRGGRMYWSPKRPHVDFGSFAWNGRADFCETPCEVLAVPGKPAQFVVRPVSGSHWNATDRHASADEAREFLFDVQGSEATLATWTAWLQAHIAYGRHVAAERPQSATSIGASCIAVPGTSRPSARKVTLQMNPDTSPLLGSDLHEVRCSASLRSSSAGGERRSTIGICSQARRSRSASASAARRRSTACADDASTDMASMKSSATRTCHGSAATELASMRRSSDFGTRSERRSSRRVTLTENLIRAAKASFQSRYTITKRLAHGAQGATYLATDNDSRRVVVVKRPFDCGDVSDFEQLATKTHPNVVRVFELFHTPEVETFVVMEFCAGGDLFKALAFMSGSMGLTENWCAAVFVQACHGVKYLHEAFGTVHNDLKPENILLDAMPAHKGDVPRVMIADFGCASRVPFGPGEMGGARGDPRYAAPELMQGALPSPKSDVWALGVVLFEMLSGGYLPFVYRKNIAGYHDFAAFQNGAILRRILAALANSEPVNVSMFPDTLGKDLIRRILVPWSVRLDLTRVLAHKWFSDFRETDLRPIAQDIRDRLRRRARLSKLHMAVLNLVATQMQGQAIQYYRELWDKYDLDHNGILHRDEFVAMIKKTGALQGFKKCLFSVVGHVEKNKLDADALFEFADVKGAGYVEFNEFVAIMFDPDMLDANTKMEYFRSAYDQLADGTKAITADQLSTLFSDDVNQDTIEDLFDEMDDDHDGVVQFGTFVRFLEQM
mmetsp:Transcript_117685/g.332962  ORF Transcript_117685/g.332962 Transcript_117685/m.332962 type:complete len:764 (+) Transcript_117685:178-2469(+)